MEDGDSPGAARDPTEVRATEAHEWEPFPLPFPFL